jgi:hypothetical protein
MAIRFQCSACSQPIEVDDEWASRAVACPYCRKTITAPAESTLGNLSEIPTATPLTSPAEQPAPPAAQPPFQPAGEPHPNRIAVVALVLALAAMALVIMYLQVLASHQAEIESFYKPGMSFGDQMEAFSEYLQSQQGSIPAWVIALSLLPITAGLCWIAAVVCAIIAVRHPQRRGLAVAALLIVGGVPLLLCCGGGLFFGGSV